MLILQSHCLAFVFKAEFEQLEREMKNSNTNYEALMTSVLELNELKHILSRTQTFFEEVKWNLDLVIVVLIMHTAVVMVD